MSSRRALSTFGLGSGVPAKRRSESRTNRVQKRSGTANPFRRTITRSGRDFDRPAHRRDVLERDPTRPSQPDVVAAAIVSLLTIRETAGRSLSQGVADEMFQSDADVRGAATTRVATELQLGRAAADRPRDAAQVDITRRSNPQPHRPCRRRADACAGRRGDDDRRRAGGQRDE